MPSRSPLSARKKQQLTPVEDYDDAEILKLIAGTRERIARSAEGGYQINIRPHQGLLRRALDVARRRKLSIHPKRKITVTFPKK